MTDREQLIGQGARTLREAVQAGRISIATHEEVEVLFDAGWRPPLSGDVIEGAARALHEYLQPNQDCCEPGPAGVCLSCELKVGVLADAGLLREPPDESWGALMALLDKHWPESVFPTPSLDEATNLNHATPRDPGPTIVSLIRWVDRLRNETLRDVCDCTETPHERGSQRCVHPTPTFGEEADAPWPANETEDAEHSESERYHAENDATVERLAIQLYEEHRDSLSLRSKAGLDWDSALTQKATARFRALAAAILDSDVIREIQAEAWAQGWDHCYHGGNHANPYREVTGT